MGATDEYLEVARAYADGVRVLSAPSGALAGERGGRGPASPEDLADQAEKLSALSTELTRAAAAQLGDADPAVRARAATRLLAKVLTDLDVSAYMLQAAEDEDEEVPWAGGKGTERGPAGSGSTEEYLSLLLGEANSGFETFERGERRAADLPTARENLSTSVEDALDLIPERAGKTGQNALNGLLLLGAPQILDAAGTVGMGIAQALGQAEKVTKLYVLFRGFAAQAFDAVVELVGSKSVKDVANQVVGWLKDLKEGGVFSELLKKLFEAEQTNLYLGKLVSSSRADLAAFAAATENVDGLEEAYRRQANLVDKLLGRLKFVAAAPAAALPQGPLHMAGAYTVLGGYAVLTAANYVDARQFKLLRRVPGVRTVVEAKLISA
jgi:hypothetical protein